MAIAQRPRDIHDLRDQAMADAVRMQYVIRLEYFRQLVAERCADKVLWLSAYGPFLNLFANGRPSFRPSRDGLELLVVTSMKSLYKAHVLLSEKVFGPAFVEFGRLPLFHVWLESEVGASAAGGSPEWRAALAGVTVFGDSDTLRR